MNRNVWPGGPWAARPLRHRSAWAIVSLLAACGGGGGGGGSGTATETSAGNLSATTAGASEPATAQATAQGTAVSVLTVTARGSLVNGVGPQMQVRLNGSTVGAAQVSATAFVPLRFNIPAVAPGDSLDIVFTNDAYLPALGQDRNLYVQSVAIQGATLDPRATSVRYDRGSGSQAFDGLNVVAGRQDMPWSGALRFTLPDAVGPRSFSFTPRALPASADELSNPLRGQYVRSDGVPFPADWPVADSYARWNWVELEPRRGQYNWALIDDRIAQAKAQRGRFGFRVMALCQNCSSHRYQGAVSSIPDDLAAVVNPLIAKPTGDTAALDHLIPDWNSPAYLDRLQELLAAIGARYADEPHLGYMDVSGYGNYGEMHLFPFDAAYAAQVPQRPLTPQSAQRIVQMNAAAFPDKLLVTTTGQKDVLAAALASTSPPIGLRIDCLGSDRLAGAEAAMRLVPGVEHRWKTAPVITEWCGTNLGTSGKDLYAQGLEQVAQQRVSMLASNLRKPPSTPEQLRDFRQANVQAGYRLRVATISAVLDAQRRNTLQLKSTWVNDNLAPTYLRWRVVLRLTGAVTVELPLALDLRQVQPDAPLQHEATLTLPQGLPPGSYLLDLRVDDVQGVAPPMRLAMEGRQSDGAYRVGQVVQP